jgi:hypothetical protein
VLELELELVEFVLDELVAGGAVPVLLEALNVDADVVVGVDGLADEVLEDAATTAELDVELEWLLEPHAATSSAGASAKPIRFNIG